MLSSEVAQSLKSYGHFSDLGSGSLSVTAMLDFSGKANTPIHGLGEDDTAKAEDTTSRSRKIPAILNLLSNSYCLLDSDLGVIHSEHKAFIIMYGPILSKMSGIYKGFVFAW